MYFRDIPNHISLFLLTVFLREWVRGWGSPPPLVAARQLVADCRRQPEARKTREEPEKPVDPKSQNGARSRAKGRAQLTLRVRPPVSVIRTTYLCPPGNQKCYQRDIFDPVIVEIPHSLNYFHSDRILIRTFPRPFLFLDNFSHFKKILVLFIRLPVTVNVELNHRKSWQLDLLRKWCWWNSRWW